MANKKIDKIDLNKLKFVDMDKVSTRTGVGQYEHMMEELLRHKGKALELDLAIYNRVSIRSLAYKYGIRHGIKIATRTNKERNKMWLWVKKEKNRHNLEVDNDVWA